MDWGLILEYGWVLLVLVALEGLLAADNALVWLNIFLMRKEKKHYFTD